MSLASGVARPRIIAPSVINPNPAESHGIEINASRRVVGFSLAHRWPNAIRKRAQTGVGCQSRLLSENSIGGWRLHMFMPQSTHAHLCFSEPSIDCGNKFRLSAPQSNKTLDVSVVR